VTRPARRDRHSAYCCRRRLDAAQFVARSSDRWVLKREYYRGMGAADTCGELQQLKQQYEFALRVWGEYQFPVHNSPVGTPGWQSEGLRLQLKQKATDLRDAANERVLDHRLRCPLCAAKRRGYDL
jgi:hypothetical protein